ncbi:hypothetical protein OG232_33225 [Streptomyces sp. NBC_01411]|uniref:choice-of-anchor P family protein n=1 Tax=Streptomyces sp. NBC_01411 TaxID=2903857 RepID=UPI0032465D26
MKRPTTWLRGKIFAALLCLVAGLLGVGVAASTAYAATTNPNPINWKVEKLFYDQYGHDVPLRTGQEDYNEPSDPPPLDGFGRVHIEASDGGHGAVPPATDIQDTIGSPVNCMPGADARVRCLNPETNLFVVYSPVLDPRSGDAYAFGIITAYYTLPCIAPSGDGPRLKCGGTPPPPAAPTTLTYTGPRHGSNGSPLTLSASLVDNFGVPVAGKTLHFRIGSGGGAQSCDGTTGAAGTARCTIGQLHQPTGSVAVAVSFAGDDGFKASSASSTVVPTSPTKLSYTGPAHGINGSPLELSATLSDYAGSPVTGRTVHFRIGSGDAAQSCDGTTSTTGGARCAINSLRQPPTSVPVAVSFAGDSGYEASSAAATVAVQSPTTLKYTGPARIANGKDVRLSGELDDYLGAPVTGRSVHFALGTGATAQSCDATTDSAGAARCTISVTGQPLNAAATVPLHAAFAGGANYLKSSADASLLLQYYTGRAFGLSAQLHLPLLPPVDLPAQPDTGQVRTAGATTATPPCTAAVSAVVLDVHALCSGVTTTLDPGTATATTSVESASIGLPGVPVIGISGLTARATARCDGATGSATLTALTIGGATVTVPTAPNSTISLPGGTRLVINEQTPVAGADHGLTVNAVHLVVAGGLGDIVIGSSTSAVHNCAE